MTRKSMAPGTPGSHRHIHTVGDLSDEDVSRILGRAKQLASRQTQVTPMEFEAATVFLTPSLRTRVGFTVAAQRLGARVVDIREARYDSSMSDGESFSDTLRTVSGMVDVIITRTPFGLDADLLSAACCPVINGGDTHHHPSQALIDLFAITTFAGQPADLTIGVCGDLSMRAVASLLELLDRTPPKRLVLASPPTRRGAADPLPTNLSAVATWSERPDVTDLDVLYLPGLPQGRGHDVLTDEIRERYSFDRGMASSLPRSATVLSPLPVVDEVASECRDDPRIRMFEQSDRSVFIRMAMLERVLSGAGSGSD